MSAGLEDLARGERTAAALLVSIAASRLRSLGLDVESPSDWPRERELALYALLRDDPTVEDAYYRYNSLLAELDSFMNALESRSRAA